MTVPLPHHRRGRPAAAADAGTPPDPAAPLGAPTMVIAVLMLAAAVGASGEIRGWATDYGRPLVYLAVALYLAIALRLLWWGAGVRRSGHTGSGSGRSSAGPGASPR